MAGLVPAASMDGPGPIAAALAGAMPDEAGSNDDLLVLRFVVVNDVYELDDLPRFGTALKQAKKDADSSTVVIGALAGDFLAPSLLSSLDRGRGMIDVLNATGLDLVCIGNHETDVPYPAFLDRIRQSEFVWINSNMPDLPLPGEEERKKVVEYLIKRVGDKKVGLLGLLTEDPSLYRPDSFSCTPILPVETEARRLRQVLMQEHGCDLVIPLTHQSVTRDRAMAAEGLFPLILAGHDHDPYIETHNGCTFVKVGCDAKLIGIVDVTWSCGQGGGGDITTPTVSARTEPAENWPPDPEIQERVAVHKQVLKELEHAVLCLCPKDVPLSSKAVRKQQTTMGTMLVTAARKALQVDCAIVNAGNIRGNTRYPLDKTTFTYADLKQEVPFPCEMVVVEVPGRVVAESIQYSRQWAHADPPQEKGGFLQVDDLISVDPETHEVTEIAGRPLKPDAMYSLATTFDITSGIDNLRPLLDYKDSHPETFPKKRDDGWGLKELLVDYFGRAVWWEILRSSTWGDLDTDKNGTIDRSELEHAVHKFYGREMGKLVVDNLMNAADTNGDGVVCKKELLSVCVKTEGLYDYADTDEDGQLSFTELWAVVERHWGDGALSKEEVRAVFSELDEDGNGHISLAEFAKAMRAARRPEGPVI